jgi:hypothetical protein
MVGGPDSTHSAALQEMVAEIKSEAIPFFEMWDSIDREEICHYTSLDSARAILTTRVLWASDILTMNDTSEFRHAVAIVDGELMARWSRLPIHFAEYFRPNRLLLLGQTWSAFVACFSSERDFLGQWRAYTRNADGVSVGFRVRGLYELGHSSNSFALIKMNYSSDELREATVRICDVALRMAESRFLPYAESEVFWSEVALLLFNFALRFKHPAFDGEKEWRILSLDPQTGIQHRDREGLDIKFINIDFRPELITQATLGPRATSGSEAALRELLDEIGFGEVPILQSTVPLR